MSTPKPDTREQELERQARRKLRFSWKIIPVFVVTGLVFYVLSRKIAGAGKLVDVVMGSSWALLSVPVGLVAFNFGLAAVRWRIILASMGVKLPLFRALSVILATWPFSLLTPSRASDLLRAVAIRELLPMTSGSSSVVAERLVDVQSLCLLSLVGSAAAGLWEWTALSALMLVGEWAVALTLLWQKERLLALPGIRRFESKLARLFDAFEALRESPRHFVMLSAASMLSWCVVSVAVWVMGLAFGSSAELLEVFAFWPLAVFVGMLPLTLAGMGTRDAAFFYLLQYANDGAVEEAPVLATTVAYAVLTTIIPAIVGVPFMLSQLRGLARPLPEAPEEAPAEDA